MEQHINAYIFIDFIISQPLRINLFNICIDHDFIGLMIHILQSISSLFHSFII